MPKNKFLLAKTIRTKRANEPISLLPANVTHIAVNEEPLGETN